MICEDFCEDVISVLKEIVTKFTDIYDDNQRTKSDAKNIGRQNKSNSLDTFFDVWNKLGTQWEKPTRKYV